ncbi:unnamed protein product [Prunus armeniaca]
MIAAATDWMSSEAVYSRKMALGSLLTEGPQLSCPAEDATFLPPKLISDFGHQQHVL